MLVTIRETINTPYEGIVRVRKLPEEWQDEETFLKYWPMMEERERERYEVAAFHNLITTAGLLAINTYLGSQGVVQGFAKYLALGTGALAGPAAADTSLVNETFRKQPSILTIVGNTTDVSVFLQATDAQSLLTEAGLYTGSASASPGSGVLASHLLFPFDHSAGVTPISIDYLIVRN